MERTYKTVIALAGSLNGHVMPVQLHQTDTLQSRRTDDVFELHTGVGSTQSRFDMLAHTSAIMSSMFFNVFRHCEVVRPLEIANEERALRFQDAADFAEHRNGIIKTMKRRIGNDEIEVCRLESHSPRIADLEESPLAQAPSDGCLTRPFDHGARAIHPDRIKVLIVPQDLQSDETDARDRESVRRMVAVSNAAMFLSSELKL